MSGSGLLPAMPPHMGQRIAHGLSEFADGEALGEVVGRRAERADTIQYFHRKRDSALLVASRNSDQEAHARSIARAYSVAIDDLSSGLHEGEFFIGVELPAPGGDVGVVARAAA